VIPVAVSIAILKHHLYDINVVINRTLVYDALSAMLVGCTRVGARPRHLGRCPIPGLAYYVNVWLGVVTFLAIIVL
jgi:hypothetical protein